MKKIQKPAPTKGKPSKTAAKEPKAILGRKRDHTRDAPIVEAALAILAEIGFDAMTMDMVAARAKAGKATLYRRWTSKPELVRDALIWMSRGSVDVEHVPDTGSIRGDLLALIKPHVAKHSEFKQRVLEGLGSFHTEHRKIAEEATIGVYGPWNNMNRLLMERAIERGEISKHANIEIACQVIVAMIPGRKLTNTSHKATYADLLDTILLPALKANGSKNLIRD